MTAPLQTTTKLQIYDDDVRFDLSLRPRILSEFIGQHNIKNNLSLTITAAKQRNEPLGHVLLYGPPGLGKTTLAHIIAQEMNAHIRITSGPAIERAGDLAAILTNLEAGDVLFIDEIHRLNKTIEEILYPAIEDYALDIVVGKGPSARTLRIDIPPFTLVGATTKLSMVSSPLRDRFNSVWRLEFYTEDDMSKIVTRSAIILKLPASTEAIRTIAQRSRQTPRIANRILRHVRDYAQVHQYGSVSNTTSIKALELLDIDHKGLNTIDRKLLATIMDMFHGGPVGVGTLAASVGEEPNTIEEVHEPYLMQIGFLARTPRGRVTQLAAYKHLQKQAPNTLLSL